MGVLAPLAYLIRRAFGAELDQLIEIVFISRNFWLTVNTLILAVTVLLASTAIALPLAWLTNCTTMRGRRFFAFTAILPLAIPAYLMAYALLGLGGEYGAIHHLTDGKLVVSRFSGFFGATIALTLYNFPYMYLSLRATLRELDPALEEIARSLGRGPGFTFFRIVLPQLKPALATGALLITLHVVADFGVVSLMRYETFSFALYLQYESHAGEHALVYAAWLGLMLIGLAGSILLIEGWLVRSVRLDRTGTGTVRTRQLIPLGRWQLPAISFSILVLITSVLLPVLTIIYWSTQSILFNEATANSALMNDPFAELLGTPRAEAWRELSTAARHSVMASAPAALLAAALALPIAYMASRYRSKKAFWLERAAYLGYATPPLAFAFALILFSGWADQTLSALLGSDTVWLSRSLAVLIYAYALNYLAEAIGPIRNGLIQASPRLEEASRSLGHNRFVTFWRVIFPLLRQSLVVSIALVFLSCMKELPLTYMLQPYGFNTLAFSVWDKSREALFADAAPQALAILVISAGFVAILLLQGRKVTR